MRKYFGIIILFLSSVVFVLAAQENCREKQIFFVEQKYWEVNISSIFCYHGASKTIWEYSGNLKNQKIIYYDTDINSIETLKKDEAISFLKKLKQELLFLKRSNTSKRKYLEAYIAKPEDFKNLAFQLITEFVLDNNEKKIVQNALKLSYIDKKLYEKTYGQRLLMWGEIISREEWGADENIAKREVFMEGCEDGSCYSGWERIIPQLEINYLANFNIIDQVWKREITYEDGRIPHKYYPVDRIILHHTAAKFVPNKEEGINYMKSLQIYHGKTFRWSDIGYHYLIDGAGNIYEGRAGGKYVLWAHTTTHNYGSIGISLMSDGYYSPEMLASLEKLTAYLWEEYGLNLTQTQYTRAPDMSGVQLWNVVLAHKELDRKKPVDPDIDMDDFRMKLKNYVQFKITD